MAYGARDLRWIGWAGTAALTLAMGFMALAALGMWLFPHLLVGLFLDPADPANGPVIPLAISFLGIAAIFQLADGAQVVGAAMLRGLHDTRVPMLFAGFGYWVVGLGSGAWLAFGAGSPNMTRHLPCNSGTVIAFSAASSARTSIPSAWLASAAFAPDFLVFFLMHRLQLGFAPVSDDGV